MVDWSASVKFKSRSASSVWVAGTTDEYLRTAGVGRSTEELQWDLNNLKTAWDAIVAAKKESTLPR